MLHNQSTNSSLHFTAQELTCLTGAVKVGGGGGGVLLDPAGSCPGQGVISLSLSPRHVAAAHRCSYSLELQTFRLVQDLQTGTQIKTAVYDSSHRW